MNAQPSVLIVEDDVDNQNLIGSILSHLDLPFHVAGDAEMASQLLSESGASYKVIIVDLALPGKDGWQLMSQIRTNPVTAETPCIAMTAFHTSKLRKEVFAAGFKAYIPKPIDVNVFASELSNFV